jgi:hypothetical protein
MSAWLEFPPETTTQAGTVRNMQRGTEKQLDVRFGGTRHLATKLGNKGFDYVSSDP